MRIISIVFSFILFTAILSGCSKSTVEQQPGTTPNTSALSYGNDVFYLRSTDYVISPTTTVVGTYSAFPENLKIDNNTGKITITETGFGGESQTGMKYKIKFQASGSNKIDSTYITIGGINYLDKIYNLSQNDSIISPIYNGQTNVNLPAGTYGISADNKLAIDPVTGKINAKESIRRNLFSSTVHNGDWEEVTIKYKSNDGSQNNMNSIDVALYYYTSVSAIPSNVSALMRAHQSMLIGVNQTPIPVTNGPFENDLPNNVSLFKPRPPCVIIVAN